MHHQPRTHRRGRPATTRADVLALLALSAVLGSLLLPGLLRAREADARAQCAANLKQIGLAIRGYTQAHDGVLPNNTAIQAVVGTDPPMNNLVSPLGSWNGQILPYLGNDAVNRLYDPTKDWYDAVNSANQQAAATRIPAFVCPAAPDPNRVVRTRDGAGKGFAAAVTDYCGVPAIYHNNNQPGNLLPGAMNHRYGSARIRVSDIGDGASNTLIVVEMADKPNHWVAGRRVADNAAKVYDAPGEGLGHGQWAAPNWNHLRTYTFDGQAPFGECAVNCNNGAGVYAFHPGGANVLFVDGSARFLSQARTTQALLVALVTTNGGEPLSPDDF
jgi:prepilin-type processing-associated H-X9-DG protein